jgi:hypothetical protein
MSLFESAEMGGRRPADAALEGPRVVHLFKVSTIRGNFAAMRPVGSGKSLSFQDKEARLHASVSEHRRFGAQE